MVIINDVLTIDLIDSIRIIPHRNEEVEGIGSGQILRSALTTPLWQVEMKLRVLPLRASNGRRIRALFNQLDRPGAFFYVYDPIAEFPQNDPVGLLHSGRTVTIGLVGSAGTVSFAGAPPSFSYQPGDMFHIDWGGRRGYFEISNAVSTNTNGATAQFETFPRMPAAVPSGTVVTLIRPQMKAQFVPGELEYATANSSSWAWGNFSLRAIQKL